MNGINRTIAGETSPILPIARDHIQKKNSVLFTELRARGMSENELDHITEMLEKGGYIAHELSDINEPMPNSTLQDCLDLVWFLSASSYQDIDDTFVRGSIRIIGISEEQSKRFKSFFNNCPGSYNRASSHFKEMTIGNQKGLDFPKGSLPLDKDLGTLVCGRLDDGSFFIKFEREALRISKPIQAYKHMKNWYAHVTSKGGHPVVGNKTTRRETDGVNDLKPSFEKVLTSWYEIEGKKVAPASEIKKHTRIFQMCHKIEEICDKILHNETYSTHPKISDLERTISDFTDSLEDSQIDFPYIASGKEVLLVLNEHI